MAIAQTKTVVPIPGAARRRRLTVARFRGLLIGLATVVAAGVVAGDAVAVDGSSLESKAQELEALRARIETLKTQLTAAEVQRSELIEHLQRCETRIGLLARDLRSLVLQVRMQEERLAALEAERARQLGDLGVQRRFAAAQVRAAYIMGRQERLRLLLNQKDPAIVSRMWVYYDYINGARVRQIETVRSRLRQLSEVEEDLAHERARLVRLEERLAEEKRGLETRQSERKSLLAALTKQIEGTAQNLGGLQAHERRLNELVERLRRVLSDVSVEAEHHKPFAQRKGQLIWPTSGRITARFGAPRKVGGMRWEGVLIAAEPGRDIQAVADGRVVFADWLRGFGLLTIVDHGDGYMSLYGHSQSIYRELGEWVDGGQVIASVGSSGGISAPALYFEMRHDGVPIDPLRWCRGPQKGRPAGQQAK
jgi:septal ring factor EnvC (AmiA/AmiB activator)